MPTEHSRLRQDVDHYLRTQGIQVDIVAETQDTSLQKILGTEGDGLLPISSFAVSSLVKRGDLVQLGVLDGVFEEIFLVSATRRIENPISSRLFRELSLKRRSVAQKQPIAAYFLRLSAEEFRIRSEVKRSRLGLTAPSRDPNG